MIKSPSNGAATEQKIPADDLSRQLEHVRTDGADVDHLHIAGGTYSVLVDGKATGGAYCLIEMRVPPGGGPNPHRHDFEEMFYILHGEVELTFRGQTRRAGAGETVNIPANAPHSFKNLADTPAHLLCMCTPAGQEDFFREVGTPANSADEPAPKMSEADTRAFVAKATQLAPRYRTELLPPS